jgi:hypothetical protein
MGHAGSARRADALASWTETSSAHSSLSASAALTASSFLHVRLLVIIFHDGSVFPHKVAGNLIHVCFFPEGEFPVRL